MGLKANTLIFINVVILLIGVITFLCYLLIDNSISYSYLHDENKGNIQLLGVSSMLLEQEYLGVSKDELLNRLGSYNISENKLEIEQDSDNDIIWVNGLAFIFKQGKLAKVNQN